MPDNVAELHRLYEQRDFILILLLCVIGVLHSWGNRELRDIEDYLQDHPMAKGDYTAWRRKRAFAKNAKRPTSVICPLHKVFRDTCPPGSRDEPEE